VPRVHILTEQRDLAYPACNKSARLGDQITKGPARLGAARIGNDAISAEFVAAFLHGEEGSGALKATARRKRPKLAVKRHVEIDRLLAALGARDELGEA